MGNEFQLQMQYCFELCNPDGRKVLSDCEQFTVKSKEQRLVKKMLDASMKKRKDLTSIPRLQEMFTNDANRADDYHYTGPLHLCLHWTRRLDKEYYSHRLRISHSGVDTTSDSTLIQLDVDLTLSGFDAVTADLFTEREIHLAEEMSDNILSVFRQFYQLQLTSS